jgi:hypothetical protein
MASEQKQTAHAKKGLINISMTKGKSLRVGKLNKNDEHFVLSWACTVSEHATKFQNTNETQEAVEGLYSELKTWFHVEKDEKTASQHPQTFPVNEFVKLSITVEEVLRGGNKTHEIYSGMSMISPDISKRRTTCYICNDVVALRLWAKQPGKWYVVAIRIVIPDPSRGKVIVLVMVSWCQQ